MTAGAGFRAAIRDVYGPPEVVRVERVPRPELRDADVLVRVVAASVNRADLDAVTARYWFARAFTGVRRPRHRGIGYDVAGVVEAAGPAVTSLVPGDRVYADLSVFTPGAFAESVAAPERAWARIPDTLSFEEAAALPHSAILAVQGLRTRDGRSLRPGDRVLVDGASGNVGPFAVQIAKARGAEVTGTCRTDKMDFVRSLGADHVIDYTAVDYTTAGVRYDWILDVDSHHSVLEVRRCLVPGGVYVTLGGSGRRILQAVAVGAVVSKAVGRSIGLMLWWKPFDRGDLATIEGLVADGSVRPVIDREYPLERVVDALRHVHDGHARGKVLIRP